MMSRLTIDITDQQHRSLQAMAAMHGKTIGEYAIERLFPEAIDEEQAWFELKTFLTQRVEDGLAGKVSRRSFREIVNEETGADGQA